MKEIITSDNNSISVYHVKPLGAAKANLVLIQEVFGVNKHIQNVCDKFAKDGFNTAAPAIFDRIEKNIDYGYSQEELNKGIALAGKVKWDNVFIDIEATIRLLNSDNTLPIFIVGYCFGGTVAFRAAHHVKNLKAAACYYGGNIYEFREEKPYCPVLMHFGSKDMYIPAPNVEAIKKARNEAVIYNYDAGHGFNCDMRNSYHKESADLAYKRTLEFFQATL